MDIILVDNIQFDASNTRYQIGLLSLKNVLNKDFDVQIVHFDRMNFVENISTYTDALEQNIANISCYLVEQNPKIIGFYTLCSSIQYTLAISRHIKALSPDIKIILGGPHASALAREILSSFSFIDIVCVGEFELQITKLVSNIIENRTLQDVSGVAYRSGNEIIQNKVPSMIPGEKLKEYTVLDTNQPSPSRHGLFIEVGRGCPFRCSFCSTANFWGHNFRIKPVEDLISEIKWHYDHNEIRRFYFVHDLFTANKKHIISFCENVISEGLPITWSCSSRIDVLDEETMIAMRNAGCDTLYIGIETGSQSMQHKINKNIDLKSAMETLKILVLLGFDVTTSFIYGFPEETEDEFIDTIKMVEQVMILGAKIQMFRFMAMPKTSATESIKNSLYFDENDISVSIMPCEINDEIKELILSNPDIFTQYYTFNTEVRSKYKYIEFFVVLLSGHLNPYEGLRPHDNLAQVINEHGLLNLYFNYFSEIECYSLLVSKSSSVNRSDNINSEANKNGLNLINKILQN